MSELLPCPFCGSRAQLIGMEFCCDVVTSGCGAVVSFPICSVTTHAKRLWNTRSMDRAEWQPIVDAARFVLDTFKKDEGQGYRSKDRQFAIAILGKAFEPSTHEQQARNGDGAS